MWPPIVQKKIAAECSDLDSDKAYIDSRCIGSNEYGRLRQAHSIVRSLAGAEGVLDIEERMGDVKRRYGAYPQEKWNSNLAINKYFFCL